MQKLTAELVIMFYALAVTIYALAVIGAGIYATVTNANGLEVLWLIALTLPSSIVYLIWRCLLSSGTLGRRLSQLPVGVNEHSLSAPR